MYTYVYSIKRENLKDGFKSLPVLCRFLKMLYFTYNGSVLCLRDYCLKIMTHFDFLLLNFT